MADEKAPYVAQNKHQVRTMIQELESHSRKGSGKLSFSVKKHTFKLPGGQTVDSWRMQDWDYKKPNLPTYARGLFTCENSNGDPEIVVRGYDKFFNHGEVRKTEWPNVEKHTQGPYELSVKENGCIIFIAGLEDGSLLVCSKHSTGKRDDVELSHANAGERWVEKHLASVGRSKSDLAYKLREMNATAVAELCDDNFEEHVLAYDSKSAGLYLHGINLNLPTFATYPAHLVDKFADEWGFKKTMFLVQDDIKTVKTFLDKVAETGNYAGRDTEGFVIRCRARDNKDAPFEDWFFKYKFEEPYLMYRQWREATKAVIAGKAPKYKKHKQITDEYLLYARRRFIKDPKLTKLYNQNHGIIQLRDDFLRERGLTGAEVIQREMLGGDQSGANTDQNIILVPVATIGCGKTTVALALVQLFQWGHIQNDNITGKKQKIERFAQALGTSLTEHPVVIADKNNHQKRERQQIFTEVGRIVQNVQYVALQYVHDRAMYDDIRKITRARVLSRGDNHQTIQAGSKGQEEVVQIMEGFLHRFQPVDVQESPDDAFDLVINLDVAASSRENLDTVVSRMYEEYPKLFNKMPTADDMDAAIENALHNYKPDIKHVIGSAYATDKRQRQASPAFSGGERQVQLQMHRQLDDNLRNGSTSKPLQVAERKAPRIEYFAVLLPKARITAVLDACFRNESPERSKMLIQLQRTRRVQGEFHVTLIHRASEAQDPELWKDLVDLNSKNGSDQKEAGLGTCKVSLDRIIWDDRLMCILASLQDGETSTGTSVTWRTSNDHAHITIGTASANIKPKESNELLKKWSEAEGRDGLQIQELKIPDPVVLEGSVRAVLSRF